MSITNEKLQTIKDNVSKVYRSGQMDVIKNANSLKGFESDKAMLLDDISPVTHEMGVRVRGKNLFDVSKITNFSNLINNGDGTLTIKANALNQSTNLNVTLSTVCPALKVGDKISFSFVSPSSNRYIYLLKSSNTLASFTNPFTVTQDDLDSRLVFYGYQSTQPDYGNPCTISNIQIELGTTSTAYTPYVPDLTAVKVSRCGKNLFDKSIAYNNWTPSVGGYKMLYLYVGKNSTVTVSLLQKYNIGLEGYLYIRCGKSDTSTKYWLYHSTVSELCNKSVTVTSEDGYITIVATEPVYNNFKDEIMVELGTTATDYEPYITPTDYTPTADGTVNGVTSLYPNTTLLTDTDGVIIDCEYYKDIDKAYNKLSAAIALSGGE